MPGQMMIAPETLNARIGAPDAPVLIDVCVDADFALDPRLIPGAFRHPFGRIGDLSPELQGRDVVVICQKGLKLSQGAAALLRAEGVAARALSEGMVGWASRGYPAIPASNLPKARVIAASGPGPDALAAFWLIRRFARSEVQILFVAPDAVAAVAERFDGEALAPFGELAKRPNLSAPPLVRLAATVSGDGVDAPGVAAALFGLRAFHPDDLSYAAACLPLFDALHRAYRNASAGREGAAA